ncbi:hypothetical protein C2S51_005319 [Perilla frutescens var. frutescens]|nr:hypothetical protein C2S51_005319 [Perilla frutescens var. frutescens]
MASGEGDFEQVHSYSSQELVLERAESRRASSRTGSSAQDGRWGVRVGGLRPSGSRAAR